MSKELRRGDIVLNGYGVDANNLHIIMGTTTRKTGRFTTSTYYKTQGLCNGKLHNSLFDKSDNKLEKIGHYDIDAPMKKAMQEAKEQL